MSFFKYVINQITPNRKLKFKEGDKVLLKDTPIYKTDGNLPNGCLTIEELSTCNKFYLVKTELGRTSNVCADQLDADYRLII